MEKKEILFTPIESSSKNSLGKPKKVRKNSKSKEYIRNILAVIGAAAVIISSGKVVHDLYGHIQDNKIVTTYMYEEGYYDEINELAAINDKGQADYKYGSLADFLMEAPEEFDYRLYLISCKIPYDKERHLNIILENVQTYITLHPEQSFGIFENYTNMEQYFRIHNLLDKEGKIDSGIWERFQSYVVNSSSFLKEEGRHV